ncbi:beta-(1,2)-xylosyltransferase-like [Cynara cardunculus var. scolymus]|uniref:beta-(1,2)-xylosyltransferase-like n=1 Tax=Cynara cardunculus var. scolymus TaxID=59895 RepID=UPI000D623455|nr:beta-(1,2)-xylosyltransferase-like [Cynara cardunculus var. scolymus]
MKMNTKSLKLLISLFILNSITLYLYFSSHPDYFRRPSSSTPNPHHFRSSFPHHTALVSLPNSNKPWPILPSYLPWSLTPNTPFTSCEAYFGNGFTRSLHLLKPSPEIYRKSGKGGGGGGWFRCFYSQTLRSSICEGGRMRMHPDKIKMSIGGEELESVIGRGEEEELPEFESGAFDLEVGEKSKSVGKKLADEGFLNEFLQKGQISRHTMRELIESIQLIGANEFECSQWIEEPTLLVTRFEYANLFHTVTDWYSAYVSSRVTGLPNRPQVVFVDGHCMTPLEETWKAVFSGLRYAKNFSGPVCFRHAILSPLGYETAMFKGLSEDIDCYGSPAHDLWQNPDEKKTARISEFGEMIRAAFALPLQRHHQNSKSGTRNHNILFVRREDYLAHPRHGGKVQSRLSNEQEVFDALKSWSWNHTDCKLNLINGLFGHMSMKEQVRAIQDASVIVGAHGAGLTHIVSATPEAEILEIISNEFRRPHFALISRWKGLKYHPIYLGGSHANPTMVIEKLRDILKSLGC